MDERILDWLRTNEGQTFRSPREDVFDTETRRFMLTGVDEEEEKVKIDFVGGVPGLPLFFWMFERALAFIEANRDRAVRLGARVAPPFDPDTVEGRIWEEPHPPPSTPYKASPHVCDVLALARLARYEMVRNPDTHRMVQGMRYSANPGLTGIPGDSPDGEPPQANNEKEEFIKKYGQTIIKWTKRHRDKIVSARRRYAWGNKSTVDCVRERNAVSKAIIMSRIKNGGAVDLDTLDQVMVWGFGTRFPMRDKKEVLTITKKAFASLDKGKLKDATMTLLKVEGIGISRASKILGLFEQENLCIYDSRVGNALKGLKHDGKKLIPCPPGRKIPGDLGVTPHGWADSYQKLIWTLEIVRDCLNERGQTYRLADVEMGLFMIGKPEVYTGG
jgi:hypothetical protein